MFPEEGDPMDYIYKGEFLHDLAGHKEFTRSYTNSSKFRNACVVVFCMLMIWLAHQFAVPSVVGRYLQISLVFLFFHIFSNPRKGNIHYKRMLQSNNGQPVQQNLYFTVDCVHIVNQPSGNHADFAYDQFRYAIESTNLLILVMRHRSCLILDKHNIKGGNYQELFDFLKERNPKLRGKHPRKTNFGKWARIALALILAVGSLWSLLDLPGFSVMDRVLKRFDNSMTYQEMAEELAPLDIHICSRTLREIEEYDRNYFNEVGEEFYEDALRYQKVADLLCWEGEGIYHTSTWWDPSNSGIYWIPTYFEDAVVKYEDFLTGLSAMDDSLVFTKVHEDRSNVDENGSGSVTLTFDYQGKTHCINMEYYYYRYFDTAIIEQIYPIISTDDHHLYVSSDNYDGILLYYGTQQEVRELNRRTTLNFKKPVGLFWE